MTRLASTLKLDMKLQVRNKLYHITLGLAALTVIAARFFLTPQQFSQALPVFFLVAIGGTTYMFVAGLMIFEKSERTLDSLLITPLTTRDYLISKAVTLTLLAMLETTTIVLIGYGFQSNPLMLYGGILLIALMMVLIGIVQVVRFDSVTDFLVPALVIGMITQLPLFILFDFGAVLNVLWYTIPTAAPFILMLGGFQDIPTWQIVYGVAYSLLWIGGLAIWAYYAFQRHIIMKGAH